MGGFLGILPGIVNGIASFFGTRDTNETNKTLTRETNAQNEALMREQWAREDNAVQRRAEDLQKAGLSKTLAAGSPASAGNLASMQAPEIKSNPIQTAIDTAYKTMSMVQDFQRRQNENALLAEQVKGQAIDNSIKNFNLVETMPIDRRIKLSILDNNALQYATNYYNLYAFGSVKGPSSVLKPAWDVANAVNGFTNTFINEASGLLEKVGLPVRKTNLLTNPGVEIYNKTINRWR